MPTPSFVAASTGVADAGGAWTYVVPQAVDPANNVIIIQILQDGPTNGAVGWTSAGNLVNLAGSSGLSMLRGPNADGSFPVGASNEARQFIYICRNPSYSGSSTISGTNSTSEDLFIRSYEFKDVNPGTTLEAILENFVDTALISQDTGDTNTIGFGQANAGSPEFAAQSFTTPIANSVISSVELYLSLVGSPTDSVVVEIQADTAGVPSGTALISASKAASAITTGLNSFVFATKFQPIPGISYWIVVHRSGTLDQNNYYRWNYTGATNPYTGGVGYYKNVGGSWTSLGATVDRRFILHGSNLFKNEVGTSATAADASVISSGSDRLALNLIAVNDDNAISEFTGETGGDWKQAIAPYADSAGTDGAIGLQIAYPGLVEYAAVTSTSVSVYGTGGVQEQEAQSFQCLAGNASYVRVHVAQNMAPTDDLIAEIQTDNGGVPSGTVIASGSVSGTDITAAFAWVKIPFTASVALSASTTYWLVLRRSGSRDGSTVYFVTTDAGNAPGYANGGLYHRDNGTWVSYGMDMVFQIGADSATINGGTGSIVDSDPWGVVGFALKPEAPSGPQTYYGITATTLTFTKAIAGTKQTFGQIAASFTFTKAVAGVRKMFGQVAAVFTLGKDVSGQRKTFGQTATALTFTKAVSGVRKTFGQVAEVFTFGKDVAGRKETFGQTATTLTFTKAVAGVRKAFGQVAAVFTFSKSAAGQRTAFGQTATVITFTKIVAATKTTFAQTSSSFTVGIYAAGNRVATTLYGIVTAPFSFNAVIIGQRKTFGQSLSSFTFGKDVQGFKETFAQIVAPFTFGEVVLGTRTTFSSTATTIITSITTSGYRVGNILYGVVVAPFTFSKSVSGQRTTFGQVVTPINFVKDVIGKAGTFGQILFPVTFTQSTNGQRITFGSLVRPFTFVKDVVGRLTTFGAIVRPFTFSKDVAGSKTTFGQTTIPVMFTKDVSAVRTTFSQLTTPFIFTKEVLARKTTFAQIDSPIIFFKEVAGRKQTFGQVAFPIDLAFSVTAEVQGIRYGRTEMSLVFGEQVAAQRKTFSQLTSSYLFAPAVQGERTTFGRFDRPFVFTKAVIGQRKTFGQLAFPINANMVVSGRRMAFGSLAMGLIFAKQTAGQRKAFGQTSSSYLLAAITQATRETFGEVDTTIDFIVDVETGRVDAFSALAFEILIGLESAGFVRPKGVILNLAKEIYLGATFVDSVYTDGQKVWPPEI